MAPDETPGSVPLEGQRRKRKALLCRFGRHRPKLTGEVDGAKWLMTCERCGLEGYGTVGLGW